MYSSGLPSIAANQTATNHLHQQSAQSCQFENHLCKNAAACQISSFHTCFKYSALTEIRCTVADKCTRQRNLIQKSNLERGKWVCHKDQLSNEEILLVYIGNMFLWLQQYQFTLFYYQKPWFHSICSGDRISAPIRSPRNSNRISCDIDNNMGCKSFNLEIKILIFQIDWINKLQEHRD